MEGSPHMLIVCGLAQFLDSPHSSLKPNKILVIRHNISGENSAT